MGFRSPLLLMSAVGLFTLGLLAPWGAPKAVADGDRLGCTTYCQNAGGYGGAGSAGPKPPPIVEVASGAVSPDADGYIPVKVTCLDSSTCQGAITLNITSESFPDHCGGGKYNWAGCSDLLVNAKSTRTIAVPLTPAALAYVRANSPVTVYADAHVTNTGSTVDGLLQVSAN
jgi:hypothetical protein